MLNETRAKACEISKEIQEDEKELGLEILAANPGYSEPIKLIGRKIAPGAGLTTRTVLGLAVLIALESDGLAVFKTVQSEFPSGVRKEYQAVL